jgi:hypothetical protein
VNRAPIVLIVLLALAGSGSGCGEETETAGGDGYTYEVPEGWKDRSDDADLPEVGFAGYEFDTVVMDEPEEGFADNVNVIVERSIAPGVDSREYAEASTGVLRDPGRFGGELGSAVAQLNPRDLTSLTRVDLDGQEAYALEYTGDQGGRVLRFRNVVAVRRGRAYGITLTALRHRFPEKTGAADSIVETWSWR